MGCKFHMIAEYELKVAMFLAGEMIPRAETVRDAKIHLQRTVNCLVGPKGPTFKAEAGYPTKGIGQGIIIDLAALDLHGARDSLDCAKLAHELATQGLQEENDLTEVRRIGQVVFHLLSAAAEALWSAEGIRAAATTPLGQVERVLAAELALR